MSLCLSVLLICLYLSSKPSLSVCISVSLLICLYLSAQLSFCLLICISVYSSVFICLCSSVFICLLICLCLSANLSLTVHLSLSVYLSTDLPVFFHVILKYYHNKQYIIISEILITSFFCVLQCYYIPCPYLKTTWCYIVTGPSGDWRQCGHLLQCGHWGSRWTSVQQVRSKVKRSMGLTIRKCRIYIYIYIHSFIHSLIYWLIDSFIHWSLCTREFMYNCLILVY